MTRKHTLRNLALALIALAAVWLAGRALRRQDEVTKLLWVLIATIATASTANTPKTRALEDRVAALVPRIPSPQPTPGTTASGGIANAGNTSYGIAGQNTISTAPGGANATWYQEVQATVNVVFGAFNAIQASYSNSVPQLNNVSSDHNQLVADHNALKTALKSAGILT